MSCTNGCPVKVDVLYKWVCWCPVQMDVLPFRKTPDLIIERCPNFKRGGDWTLCPNYTNCPDFRKGPHLGGSTVHRVMKKDHPEWRTVLTSRHPPGTSEGAILVFSVNPTATQIELTRRLEGHSAAISDLITDPKGRQLFSADEQGSIHLWQDISTSAEPTIAINDSRYDRSGFARRWLAPEFVVVVKCLFSLSNLKWPGIFEEWLWESGSINYYINTSGKNLCSTLWSQVIVRLKCYWVAWQTH